MKRHIALLLSLLLLGLAGCGRQERPAVSTAAPTESVTESTTVPATVPPTETTVPTEPAVVPEPSDDAFVKVVDYIPGVYQGLAYATANNFTGQPIYDFTDAYLRYGTVKKLAAVCEELAGQGLTLKIWDGFRPVSAQFKLWDICPDPTYVANPNTGYSSHSRGNTVDVTLADLSGSELEMPTGFDDFSALADRNYADCPETAAANAQLLQDAMEKYGFSGYFGEWWHFSDKDAYPVEEFFSPIDPAWYYADCNEFISLRTEPDTSADVITRIPVNGEFQVLALYGDFALADYQGQRGYVLRSYIQPVP